MAGSRGLCEEGWMVPRPGFEPGSRAREARILGLAILPRHLGAPCGAAQLLDPGLPRPGVSMQRACIG